ncbi:MAG: hypothetical protein Q8P02_04400 [Candidatus Micrarchaeota archaeon]|nr:hypothetical protein [Candidatus Micrarchaeota archaeon]
MFCLANVTLFVPDDLKKRMDAHAHLRWSRVIRNLIERSLDDFERAKSLAQKNRLSESDARMLASKVDAALGKRARELLDETRRGR